MEKPLKRVKYSVGFCNKIWKVAGLFVILQRVFHGIRLLRLIKDWLSGDNQFFFALSEGFSPFALAHTAGLAVWDVLDAGGLFRR